MDIIRIFTILLKFSVSFFIAGIGILFIVAVIYFLYKISPLLIGIGSGAILWFSGHDNIGLLIGIAGVVLQIAWVVKSLRRSEAEWALYPSPDDPMSDKKARYNKDGEIIGYEDW